MCLRSKGKGKDSQDIGKSKDKDTKNESSKKVKAEDQRRCYYCQKTGHVWSQCGSRLNDLADAEERSVIANSHPNDTAAIVLVHCSLPNEYVMTFPMALPCGVRETPCEYNNAHTTLRSDAGSIAPKLTCAIPTCETFLMVGTCAGGSICPRGSDPTAQKDTTVVTMQLVTALDDPVHGHVGKTHFGSRDGRKLQVQHDEGGVSFSTVSISEPSQRGNWFAGCQAMLPGVSGEHHAAREMDSNAIKLEEHRGVFWLPGTVTEPLNGVPLCPNPETARTAVGETAISATDSDIATQLEGSEETSKDKHKTLPRNVNRDRHDARQDAQLQIKSRSGKTVDHAHRPQAGTHGSEAKVGRDHFFLAKRQFHNM